MTAEPTNEPAFDPTQGMIKLSGKEYLTVAWRIEWLRREHPNATIITEALALTDTAATFRATVTLPDGAVGTGHGSQTVKQFAGGFLEKAETKAIGRALGALGYGTLGAFLDDQDGETLADAPQPRPQPLHAPTPTPLKVEDWPDEKLLIALGQPRALPQQQRLLVAYLGRATDRDTLLERTADALRAGVQTSEFKALVVQVATTRGDALGLPRKGQPAAPPADDLTAVVGGPSVPHARLIALVWATARQLGWSDERVRQYGRQLRYGEQLATWSADQLNSFVTFLRQGSHQAAG